MKEEEFLLKRLKELSDSAWKKNIYTFTGFLNMAELSLFYKEAPSICASGHFYKVFGGMELCERCMIRFGSEESFGYDVPFPIACIHIRPTLKKFSDALNHRDFLGALINLGIKRETLGDIVIRDNEAFVFCVEEMAEFIVDNLDRVKHTSVKCCVTENVPEISRENLKECNINVPSLRLDCIVGEVYRLSRASAQGIIREKKVFINGRLCENNSCNLKAGDVVSVRGYGRFRFKGENYISKKGRVNAGVEVFI